MSFTKIIEYTQNGKTPITVEYYYKGEHITNPVFFFEQNPLVFEYEFPQSTDIIAQIVAHHTLKSTHKLIISENGFFRIEL